MKKSDQAAWDNYYQNNKSAIVNHDNWLLSYIELFQDNEYILELGCGFGFNSTYLHSCGHNIIATDYSEDAINSIECPSTNFTTMVVDISEPLPFADGTFDSIIADLSLHYFDKKKTKEVINEIIRVLNKNGKLFCRLTSNQEYNYHFVKGENIGDQITQIEEDYFLIKDTYKRFFTEDSIKHFFQDMDLISLKNYDIGRHQQKKNLYEIIYRKL